MRLFSLWLAVLLGSCVMVLGCSTAPAAPEVPLRSGNGALGMKPELASGSAEGPLQVAYFAPVGEAAARAEIAIAFDRPIAALTDTDATGLVELVPQVPGKARFLGSQTLLFEPAAPLPMASEFQV